MSNFTGLGVDVSRLSELSSHALFELYDIYRFEIRRRSDFLDMIVYEISKRVEVKDEVK